MKSIIFIHRSVGRNLIKDGNVYDLIGNTGTFTFSDYDQNVDILTGPDGAQQKMHFSFPVGNTRPQDLAIIFSENVPEQYKPIQEMALDYDIVAIKSCYPNSNIAGNEELEAIKSSYQAKCHFFTQCSKVLVILTSPPLVPFATNSSNAARARQLSSWLACTTFGNNIKVFNLFDLLAAPQDDKQANMLKKEYKRWLPIDSHPNKRASEEIAPQLVNFL